MKAILIVDEESREISWYITEGDDNGIPFLIKPRNEKKEGERKPGDPPGHVH